MIGITKDRLGAQIHQFLGRDAFDRCLRADRHEGGRGGTTMGRPQLAEADATFLLEHREAPVRHHILSGADTPRIPRPFRITVCTQLNRQRRAPVNAGPTASLLRC